MSTDAADSACGSAEAASDAPSLQRAAGALTELLGSDAPLHGEAAVEHCRQLASTVRGREHLLTLIEYGLEQATQRPRVLGLLRRLPRDGAPLRVLRIALKTAALNSYVDLLMVPSIFEPEDWSFTFLEGLLRQPADSYDGKHLAELGAGSGWISIALLLTTQLTHATALDLNPIAVRVARINGYLNSYDDHGKLRGSAARPLFERLTVLQSDLLGALLALNQRVDLVVGCIPQVLSPSPELDTDRALRTLDEQRLYDLSNYFVLQGVYEDQFGLGLLARALEQSARLLEAHGRVILNVAGRPGAQVIERMFRRRGYHVREIWSRRVCQAADTDISVLARVERRSGHLFEFYVRAHSREPIGAQTALVVQRAGRAIWHDLRVLEARLNFERELAPFFTAMHGLGYGAFLEQIDLSAISLEQVAFLRQLAEYFVTARVAPYTHERGSPRLRQHLKAYLERHFGVRLARDDLFVGPSRQWLVLGLLVSLCSPEEQVLACDTSYGIYEQCCREAQVSVIRGNSDCSELVELVRLLRPRVVLFAPKHDTHTTPGQLHDLVAVARATGSLVILDGSELFDITSRVHVNTVFEFLASEASPQVLVITGLTHNRVYPSLQPAFVVCRARELSRALIAFAEASYSRVNSFTELYYEGLFEEILSFQLERAEARSPSSPPMPVPEAPALTLRISRLLAWPALRHTPPSAPDVVRLDYGENELAMPDRLVQGILFAFTNLSDESPVERLPELLAAWHAFTLGQTCEPWQFVVGPGTFPLLRFAALALAQQLGRAPRVAIAEGHYGFLPTVFELAGCEVVTVAAAHETGFELTRAALEALDAAVDVLMIVNPNNPSGVFYARSTLEGLRAYAHAHGAWIFSDEIFSDLDLGGPPLAPAEPSPLASTAGTTGTRLTPHEATASDAAGEEAMREKATREEAARDDAARDRAVGDDAARQDSPWGDTPRVLHFNGVSKRFAAGGLRVGWLRTRERAIADVVRKLCQYYPAERQANIAVEVLLRGFAGASGIQRALLKELAEYTANVSAILQQRRACFAALWERAGARLPPGRPAGLFIFPEVTALYGRRVTTAEGPLVLREDNLAGVLLHHFGLRVNDGPWAGTRGHLRVCFSLSEARFAIARERLESFVAALSP